MPPNLLKGRGMCLYDWCTKKNVWSIGTCPITILLSTMNVRVEAMKAVAIKDLWHLWLADLYAPQGVDLEKVAPFYTGVTQLKV